MQETQHQGIIASHGLGSNSPFSHPPSEGVLLVGKRLKNEAHNLSSVKHTVKYEQSGAKHALPTWSQPTEGS